MTEVGKPKSYSVTGCFNFVLSSTLVYFFYTYSYNNPDQGECWVSTDISSLTASPTQSDVFSVNVSKQFETWFWCGLVLNLLLIAYSVFACLYELTRGEFWVCLANGVSLLPIFTASVIWFAIGAYFRWRHAGRICSGDFVRKAIEINDNSLGRIGELPYQWKSGKFMHIYLLVIGGIFCSVLFCACAIQAVLRYK